jgi:hypothetical protein
MSGFVLFNPSYHTFDNVAVLVGSDFTASTIVRAQFVEYLRVYQLLTSVTFHATIFLCFHFLSKNR